MPIFGGKKTLWKIKEFSKYDRKIDGSEIPPIYDLGKFNEVHRELDAILRPFWENLHPAVQDFITTWNDAWTNLLHEKEDLNSQINQKETLIDNLKMNFETKLNELNSIINTLKAELQSKENEIDQKSQFIRDLELADKENKLGISELRQNLENRLKQLNTEMSVHQKQYEETQMQVGQAFQKKVLELDSEIMGLQEQLAEKEDRIKELLDQIKILQKESQKVQFYELKVQKLENKLTQIAEILGIEEEEEQEEEEKV